MKLAIFSDIHSNVWALETILSDVKSKGINTLINLGDIFHGPLAPQETYNLLQTQEIITIRGNHERYLSHASKKKAISDPIMRFVLSRLDLKALNWIDSLPKTFNIEDDVFLCHGTPDDDNTYLLEDIVDESLVTREEKDVACFLSGIKASLILCGHSHLHKVVSLKNGQVVVNPGSVGLPAFIDEHPKHHKVENYSHHTSYVIANKTTNGWNIECIKLTYPYQQAALTAKKNGFPEWAFAIETGRNSNNI